MPTAPGTYTATATVVADANYSGATSAAYAFTIAPATSTIVVTGSTTYTYNGSGQGPTTSTETGSTGAITYSYSGTGSTTYGPSATLPSAPGTYTATATVAADANYNGATSAAYAFTINKKASAITVTGTTSYIYNGSGQGPTTSTETGSTGAITYSYTGTNGTTYGPSTTRPTAPGNYTVTATVAADANYNAATSAAYAFIILPPPPAPIGGTYIVGANGNPSNIVSTVNTPPSGSKILYCDANGNSCSLTAPTLSINPGIYIYCIKNIDTISGLISSPCVFDTIRIYPGAPVVTNGTYYVNGTKNPANISLQVTGSNIKYFVNGGSTAASTTPGLPGAIGVYNFSASQTVNSMESAKANFTVTMISSPIKVYKTVSAPVMEVDGSFNINITLKANNLTPASIDSLIIDDDLSKVFPIGSTFNILSVNTSGNLSVDNSYNGNSYIHTTVYASKLAASSSDSVKILVNLKPNGFGGTLYNTANVTGKGQFGWFQDVSTDPAVTSSTPVSTQFVIPSIDIVIAGGLSPNHDGLNDNFIITRPYNTKIALQVFNRWGNVVYKSDDYQNDWAGKGQGNFLGQDLPSGTYFYIVVATDATGVTKRFTGPITLVR